ncbi:GEVED domain-containing protein [Fulvivirga ulvae]|uniref:M43 family zinc metalloprotease n=1 Tax=Fulvivirga ulvae TaxID=2904245 RepID=UPI001EEEB230|nr:M43 family zinc metalloprotease [Fulvivirga ulvae]UII35012.1 GEVED domain-containing protein [Fulvivirga ulvae]
MKKTILLLFMLIPLMSVYAQDHNPALCRSDALMKELYEQHPESLQEARKFESSVSKLQSQKVQSSQYIVPVVFHVFGTNFSGQTVDNNTVITALQKVNEDFNGLNDDYTTVSPLFSGIKSTLDIEFKLAQLDPNGNPTTGINYYPVRSGFGNGGGYDSEIQQFAWDNYMYMNVYIMLDLYDDNTYNNSGVAWYPDSWMSNNNLARVVYNGRYLYGNTDKEFASVLTHEFGHWLNLAHTFDNGCSSPGDNVADTPATTSNSGTCNTTTEKCPGAGIPNGENYMDYSNCYKMFTQGQVARMVAALNHNARKPLWQEANLIATGVGSNPQPRLLYSSSNLKENDLNSGGIEGSVIITAENGAQFATTGVLTEGTHFSVTNVPSGLSAKINVQNSGSATLSFTGSAVLHSNQHDVSNIKIEFLDPALAGGTSSVINPVYNNFSLDFKDPYKVIYQDINDITANASATWTYFTLNYGNGEFGCWYDNGNLRLETYEKALISEGSLRNISLLPVNTAISSSSNWIPGGPYPDEHNLRTSNYTNWDGKSGYIGFRFSNPEGKLLHGWFRVSVNSNGTSFTLHDYAYYTKPGGTILAGAKSAGTISAPTASFQASSVNVTTGASVSFTDGSSNEPAAWSWFFEGGTPSTSTAQNPVVTYNTAGSYDVQLIVSNTAGADTLLMTDYITVSTATNEYCSSGSDRSTYEYIASVSVNDFTHTSGATNYSDFTDKVVPLSIGSNAVTLVPGFSGDSYAEYFRVWVDFNGDGDFTDSGELAFDAGSTSATTVTGVLTVPTNAIEGPSRMRVSMKYNGAPSACENFADGEVEDYTADISTGTATSPSAPSGLSASVSSATSISLEWTDNASTETSFEIERSVNGGSYSVVNTTGANVNSYEDTGLAASTSYSYRVRAKNGAGYSAYSNTSSATTPGQTVPEYCVASAGNPSGQYIKSVSAGSISNNSSYDAGGYTDYTTLSTSVGTSLTLTVTPHTKWAGTRVKGWVDWNRDGDFTDSGEEVYSVSGTGNYERTISVPSGVSAGSVVLRVRTAYGQAPTPCGAIHFSETEDYTLNVGYASSSSMMGESYKVFPNPIKNNQVQFVHPAYEGELEVIIYDIKGNVVYKENLPEKDHSGKLAIRPGDNLEGFFFIRFTNQGASTVNKLYFQR